jgi:23S rRNA (cytosine1962-C5)-methyltransferase
MYLVNANVAKISKLLYNAKVPHLHAALILVFYHIFARNNLASAINSNIYTYMQLESPQNWKDYELIDSGNFEKLERFGNFILARPEPKALWDKSLSAGEWQSLTHTKFLPGAGFGRAGKEDSGSWKMLKKMPEQWVIKYPDTISSNNKSPERAGDKRNPEIKLRLGLTSFKHVGVFPEQAPNWDFIYNQVRRITAQSEIECKSGNSLLEKRVGAGEEGVVGCRDAKGEGSVKVLNLFAYTGAASLAAKAAGADVTHLDSVRQVVTWAKNNMEISGLDNIRWVVEDAMKYVRREVKRGNMYNGIILDPPAYGHGPNGETWKLDELLYELLIGCSQILEPVNSFMVLNLYSNGYSAMLADTAVRSAFKLLPVCCKASSARTISFSQDKTGTNLTCGELVLKDGFGKILPLSVFSRLVR